MIEVELPDGTVAEFPAGTSREDIASALQRRFGAPEATKSFGQRFVENIVGDDDPTTQNFGEKVGTWMNKAGEAMTLGLIGDEASAAVESALPGMSYHERRDHYRQQQDILERENPIASFGADLVGGGLAGLATGGVASAPTVLGTIGRGAGLGLAEGGLYGFLEGEGGVGGRAANAASQGAQGLAVGGAAPIVVGGVARAGRAVADPVLGALGIGNQSRAGRAMMQTVGKSGKSVEELAKEVADAASEGQPEFRLMDALGQAGQRRASGVVRSGGDGADELGDFIRQRQVDQPDRLGEMIREAFGFRGAQRAAQGTDLVPQGYQFQDHVEQVLRRPTRSAQQLSGDLTAARGAAADTAYAAARERASPVDVRGAVSVIDDRIGGMQGSNIAGDSIDAKLSRYRRRLIADPAPGDEISRELSDFDRVLGLKQAIQDDIGAAVRAGRNNEARELGKLVRELDGALEAASPDYRAANDAFRDASRVIEGVDTGAQMQRTGRAVDNVQAFRSMAPDQQQAARVGYGNRALEEVEHNRAQAPLATRPFNSTKAREEVATIALNPEQFSRQVGRENAMHETYQRALGGSRTADNLQDIGDLSPLADTGRAVRDAASGNMFGALGNLGAAVRPFLSGQNEATRAQIAKMLMSDQPVQALQRAARARGTNEATRRAIEEMLKAAARGQFNAE
ncbi:hypothetical protein [Alloyangia pacifica]|uniref:hypothetical protein n=1 Tax=Alloyangia pacifica TaxID=311180 RepID=UPI0031DB28DD